MAQWAASVVVRVPVGRGIQVETGNPSPKRDVEEIKVHFQIETVICCRKVNEMQVRDKSSRCCMFPPFLIPKLLSRLCKLSESCQKHAFTHTFFFSKMDWIMNKLGNEYTHTQTQCDKGLSPWLYKSLVLRKERNLRIRECQSLKDHQKM